MLTNCNGSCNIYIRSASESNSGVDSRAWVKNPRNGVIGSEEDIKAIG